jgi:hypothetical protein
VSADELDFEAVTGDAVDVVRRLEVRALDREGAVCVVAYEAAGRVERVHDRHAEAAAASENAGGFAHRAAEIGDVLQ